VGFALAATERVPFWGCAGGRSRSPALFGICLGGLGMARVAQGGVSELSVRAARCKMQDARCKMQEQLFLSPRPRLVGHVEVGHEGREGSAFSQDVKGEAALGRRGLTLVLSCYRGGTRSSLSHFMHAWGVEVLTPNSKLPIPGWPQMFAPLMRSECDARDAVLSYPACPHKCPELLCYALLFFYAMLYVNHGRRGGFLRMNGSAGAFLRGGRTPEGGVGRWVVLGTLGTAGGAFVGFLATYAASRSVNWSSCMARVCDC
jgi:hypothetical protein